MSKSMYDSDEELFFEPPKLSQYSMALLNDNKENVPGNVLGDLKNGEFVAENADLKYLDHDNDIIIPERETAVSVHKLTDRANTISNADGSSKASRKRSFQGLRLSSSRLGHNPIGHPRRVSSRKSSTEANEINFESNNKKGVHNNESNTIVEQRKVPSKEHDEDHTNSNSSSHSHAGGFTNHESNTVTNETSTTELEKQYFDNLTAEEYIRLNNIPSTQIPSILHAYKQYITKSQTLQTEEEEKGSRQVQTYHNKQNEQELYEQLRRDRAKQEALEMELEKKQLLEAERHKREEKRIEEQKLKKERLENLRIQEEAREALKKEQEKRIKEKELEKQRKREQDRQEEQQKERLAFAQQQRERQRLFQEEQERMRKKDQVKLGNLGAGIDRHEVLHSHKSFAQTQREHFNVVKSVETAPLKQNDYQRTSQNRIIVINGTNYESLELIGKGGSSKVYKVKSLANNKVYAVKEVMFDEFDEATTKGFKGEIELLVRMREKKRIVRLVDYSMQDGCLYLIMECGDNDLARVLSNRSKYPLDINAVRFHTKELFMCVQEVHDAGIVHSDLKPANFLFVKGVMKVIDFGISNAVPEHTVNIYRDTQIGTPNYMAPEALVDANIPSATNPNGTWKVGRPSDIWSCGCIVYQMIYGQPPYAHFNGNQRLFAIMNPEIQINYPEKGLGNIRVPKSAIQLMKSCLQRDPKQRLTAEELLKGSFLNPRVITEQFLQDLIGSAIQYGASNGSVTKQEVNALASDVWDKIHSLNY